MSVFFDGWVKHICEEVFPISIRLFGGDDLFLIAPWDIVPDLALRISTDFASYTAATPTCTSAGNGLYSRKIPGLPGAKDALEALSAAKDRPGKRAFSFLAAPGPGRSSGKSGPISRTC
jgi:CRISPR/Cas system-associated protein Cas10 (large subunit of type III CRISPR-Cas system)